MPRQLGALFLLMAACAAAATCALTPPVAPARAESPAVPVATVMPTRTRMAPQRTPVSVAGESIALSKEQRLIFVEVYADW